MFAKNELNVITYKWQICIIFKITMQTFANIQAKAMKREGEKE